MTKQVEHTPSEARTIDRLKIDSSNISSVGYYEKRRVLAVQFLASGLVLHYDDVPIDTFEDFARAESRGSFYAKNIRGKFKARVMSGLCPKCAAWGYVGEQCEGCGGATIREVDRTHKP